jgi:hypothetical protein
MRICMLVAALALLPMACAAQDSTPSTPPGTRSPFGTSRLLRLDAEGNLTVHASPGATGQIAPPRPPGTIGLSCVSSAPERRPGETVVQYQWRICQGGHTCYLCPDGQEWGAPRDSIPQEWLPN